MRRRGSRVPLVVALLAILLVAPGASSPLAGCTSDDGSGGRACTEIGCNDGATFVLDPDGFRSLGDLRARACLDGRCRSFRLDDPALALRDGIRLDVLFPAQTLDPAAAHTASIVITDGTRITYETRHRLRLERSQPNGDGCPPTCHNATVRVTAEDVRAYRAAA